MRTSHHSLLRGRHRVIRNALRNLPSVTWSNTFQGSLQMGDLCAHLTFEQGDCLTFRLPLEETAPPLLALAWQRDVAGNGRHALVAERRVAMADTQLDGVAHLLRSVDEIAAGLQSIAKGLPLSVPQEAPLVDLSSAIDGLPYAAEDVVRLDKAFELRVRVQGKLTPVRVTPEFESARIHRVVLNEVPEGEAAEAIAHEALRMNAALRLARLSIRQGQLIAETCLHAGQLSSAWIQKGAEAVAVAAHCAHTPLTMLAHNSALVECYAALWLSRATAMR